MAAAAHFQDSPAVAAARRSPPIAAVTPLQADLLHRVASLNAGTGLWPSITYLAALEGVSYTTMQQRVYTLERKGWLLRSAARIGDMDPRGVRLPANADLSRLRIDGNLGGYDRRVAARADAPRADSAGGVDAGKGKRRPRRNQSRAAKTQRPCLCCGHPFASEGAHNRVCGPCKHTDGWRSGDLDAGYRVVL